MACGFEPLILAEGKWETPLEDHQTTDSTWRAPCTRVQKGDGHILTYMAATQRDEGWMGDIHASPKTLDD